MKERRTGSITWLWEISIMVSLIIQAVWSHYRPCLVTVIVTVKSQVSVKGGWSYVDEVSHGAGARIVTPSIITKWIIHMCHAWAKTRWIVFSQSTTSIQPEKDKFKFLNEIKRRIKVLQQNFDYSLVPRINKYSWRAFKEDSLNYSLL